MSNKLAAHLLFMDQSDPNIDYNDESLNFQYSESYYIDESIKLVKAINFILFANIHEHSTEQEIAVVVYDAARVYDKNNIRGFFKRLYQLLFHSDNGPRMPTFIKIYGWENFRALIAKKLNTPLEY